jgi:hypothetical protein
MKKKRQREERREISSVDLMKEKERERGRSFF